MASIEHRQSRNGSVRYWRVVWREDDKKQTERFRSERAAVDFRRKVEAAGNRWPFGWVKGFGFGVQEAPDPDAPPTFAEFARATIHARSTANARTRDDYLRDLERHVFPTFGDMPVDKIDRQAVGRWVIELQNEHDPDDERKKRRSVKTVKNVQGLASSIMADAIKQQLATSNPFKGSLGAQPTSKHEEMCFLTRAEFDALLGCVSEHYRPLTRLLAMTGLRWSEATALQVGQVDLARNRTNVVRAWKRTPGGYQELGEPKSRRSRRSVSIPASVTADLAALCADRDPGEFVFRTRDGRPVRHNNYYMRVWRPAVAQADLGKRPRIHDLRHSHASWLIAAGWSLAAIQRRLGHESITTTIDRYGHLEDAYDDAIAAALDG